MTGMIATLAGHTVTHGSIYLPAWGAWHAEIQIDGEHVLAGSVSIKYVDLSLVGTVLSGGIKHGRSSYRIVGGAGGWGKVLAKKSYSSDAGVRLASVVSEAAAECGERVEVSGDVRLGPSFTRPEGPAGRVLEIVAPSGWYVGEDGITRIGARAASTVSGLQVVGDIDKARKVLTVAPESGLSKLVPGATVEGLTAIDVHHEISPKGIRATIYAAQNDGGSRRLAAWRALFDQLDARRAFRGTYEFRVVTQDGERLNLQPVRASSGMPSLRRVPVWPGVPGAKATLALGAKVLVTFADGDPGQPRVVGFEDADGSGFVPAQLSFSEGTQGIARVGDAIVAGPYTGTIQLGSNLVRCG